jgi:hypothetical protein
MRSAIDCRGASVQEMQNLQAVHGRLFWPHSLYPPLWHWLFLPFLGVSARVDAQLRTSADDLSLRLLTRKTPGSPCRRVCNPRETRWLCGTSRGAVRAVGKLTAARDQRDAFLQRQAEPLHLLVEPPVRHAPQPVHDAHGGLGAHARLVAFGGRLVQAHHHVVCVDVAPVLGQAQVPRVAHDRAPLPPLRGEAAPSV